MTLDAHGTGLTTAHMPRPTLFVVGIALGVGCFGSSVRESDDGSVADTGRDELDSGDASVGDGSPLDGEPVPDGQRIDPITGRPWMGIRVEDEMVLDVEPREEHVMVLTAPALLMWSRDTGEVSTWSDGHALSAIDVEPEGMAVADIVALHLFRPHEVAPWKRILTPDTCDGVVVLADRVACLSTGVGDDPLITVFAATTGDMILQHRANADSGLRLTRLRGHSVVLSGSLLVPVELGLWDERDQFGRLDAQMLWNPAGPTDRLGDSVAVVGDPVTHVLGAAGLLYEIIPACAERWCAGAVERVVSGPNPDRPADGLCAVAPVGVDEALLLARQADTPLSCFQSCMAAPCELRRVESRTGAVLGTRGLEGPYVSLFVEHDPFAERSAILQREGQTEIGQRYAFHVEHVRYE